MSQEGKRKNQNVNSDKAANHPKEGSEQRTARTASATEGHPPFHLFGILRRVWRLLTQTEKNRAGFLFIGIIINSFVDLIGLAAVIPVIGLVIDPSLIQENAYLSRAFEMTTQVGIDTERRFLMLASIGLVVAFLFKALVNLGLNLIQTRYSFAIGHRISGLMWQYHFSQSLERMRSTESGRVLEEINRWPIDWSRTFVVGNLRFINEVFVLSLIALGLLIYEPLVLLSVTLLLTTGGLAIRKVTRSRLNSYSSLRRSLEPKTGTLINNAIQGFLEVLSFRASDAIRKDYLKKTQILHRIASNALIMNIAPAKLYEVLAVTAVSTAILISLLLGESNDEFLDLLILMALSAYRIMPSMTRLNGQIMELRGNYYLLNAIEEAIIAWSKNTDNPDSANYVPVETAKVQWKQIHISLKQVTVGYQSLPSPILTDVQCEFGPGKVHAIVGPSGSGKSTLINAILGLHPLKSGTIELTQSPINVNSSISSMPLKSWLSHIGYLSQHPFLFSGSLRENLTMRVPNMVVDEIQFEKLIEHLGLTDCLGKTPLDFNLFEGGNNLSGGQQQRIAILRALRMDRPVLILDEATSALDGSKRDAVFELLRNRANSGTNVILVTHDMSLAKQCDTLLDLGNAHEQPVQRILEKEKT